MKLTLKAKANNWELFTQRRQSPKFLKIRQKLLERFNYTCQFCHYRANELEIINVDNNYRNNKANNLVTACELCSKVTLLDAYSVEYEGKDMMVYMPEITQEQVSQLARILFCKMAESGEGAYNAKMILAQLQDKAAWLDERAGCKLSHPAMFVHYSQSKTADIKLINKLRWLPALESYENVIPKWQEALALSEGEV